MRIEGFELTRFQFARDRVIGDSQVRADQANVAAAGAEQARRSLAWRLPACLPFGTEHGHQQLRHTCAVGHPVGLPPDSVIGEA